MGKRYTYIYLIYSLEDCPIFFSQGKFLLPIILIQLREVEIVCNFGSSDDRHYMIEVPVWFVQNLPHDKPQVSGQIY